MRSGATKGFSHFSRAEKQTESSKMHQRVWKWDGHRSHGGAKRASESRWTSAGEHCIAEGQQRAEPSAAPPLVRKPRRGPSKQHHFKVIPASREGLSREEKRAYPFACRDRAVQQWERSSGLGLATPAAAHGLRAHLPHCARAAAGRLGLRETASWNTGADNGGVMLLHEGPR